MASLALISKHFGPLGVVVDNVKVTRAAAWCKAIRLPRYPSACRRGRIL